MERRIRVKPDSFLRLVWGLIAFLLAIGINTCARAYIVTSTNDDGVFWTLNENGTLTIYYESGGTDQIIDDGDVSWRDYNNQIKEIIIQSGYKEIGWYAFEGLTNVTFVSLPYSVEIIGSYAFADCNSLKTISLTYVKTIESSAFEDCSSLEKVIFSRVSSIGWSAFRSCSSLSEVTFTNDTLRSLGSSAFYGCKSLKSIYLPPNITEIDYGAFQKTFWYDKTNDSSGIYVDENDDQITGTEVYVSKDSVTALSLGNANLGFIDPDYAGIELLYVEKDNSIFGPELVVLGIPDDVEEAVIPYGVKRFIKYGVKTRSPYWGSTENALKKIWLPSTLQSVDEFPFSRFDSDSLDIYIDLNASVVNDIMWTGKAICDDIHYPKIHVWRTPSSSNWYVMRCDSDITEAVFPPGTEGIYMEGCTEITQVIVPEGVTFVSFTGCSSLASVALPSSLENIDNYDFQGCSSLVSVTIPNGVKSIGDYAFADCFSLQSITIPNSVIEIGNGAFSACSSLKNITIPNNVTSVGDYAFYGCTNLQSAKISNCVKNIGNYTFADCNNLSSVNIPSGVVEIGECAFSYCTQLQNIVIPDQVSSIGDWGFYHCSRLSRITIPESVNSIGYACFAYCNNMTEVFLTDGVYDIGDYAFSECPNLTMLVLSEGYVTYYAESFYVPYRVANKLVLPDNIMTIDTEAFVGGICEAVIIPEGCTTIGSKAFANCKKLLYVRIPSSVANISNDAFSGSEMVYQDHVR